MIKFENFLNEEISNADFVNKVKQSLEGVNYDLLSSPAQLKNGTLVIFIKDANLFEEALQEWGIKDSDFIDTSAKQEVKKNWMTAFPAPKGERQTTPKPEYVIYSRGGVRLDNASSDSFKFLPEQPSPAIEWIKDHYKRWIIEATVNNYIKPESFFKSKKQPLDLDKAKDYFEKGALDHLIYARDNHPVLFAEISPDLFCLCVLAYLGGFKIYSDTYRTRDNSIFNHTTYRLRIVPLPEAVVSSDLVKTLSSIELYITLDWKVGRVNKTVKLRVQKEWMDKKTYSRYPSATVLATKHAEIPEYVKLILENASKTRDFNFAPLMTKFRGSIASHKFGI